MRTVVRLAGLAVVAVLATHALAYHLIAQLPDAATRMAALLGGHEPTVQALRERFVNRSYVDVLARAAVGDFGMSVDGVPVLTALAAQAAESLPRFLASALCIAALATFIVHSAVPKRKYIGGLEFLCLVPPYVPAFGGLALLLLAGRSVGADAITWILVVASSAVIPAAVIAAQAMRAVSNASMSDYALFARSFGLTAPAVRRLLRHEVWLVLTPSLERTVLWVAVNLMFAELVLSLPGFGSGFASALRRSDASMVIAQVTALAAMSNCAWALSSAIRAKYGVHPGARMS